MANYYRKRFEAVQWKGDNFDDVSEMLPEGAWVCQGTLCFRFREWHEPCEDES